MFRRPTLFFYVFTAFPKNISTAQQYKVLGNSLNVVVVARLLQLLLSEHFGCSEGGEELSVSEGPLSGCRLSTAS